LHSLVNMKMLDSVGMERLDFVDKKHLEEMHFEAGNVDIGQGGVGTHEVMVDKKHLLVGRNMRHMAIAVDHTEGMIRIEEDIPVGNVADMLAEGLIEAKAFVAQDTAGKVRVCSLAVKKKNLVGWEDKQFEEPEIEEPL
jgi:hypothetical protein